MSNITTAYNAVINKMDFLFNSKSRLHNPYNIDENPDVIKKDSWGIKVGSASREVTEFCNLSMDRTFTIVFLKQFVSLAGKEDGFDAVTLSLMESQQTIINTLFSPSELGAQASIDRIEISEVSGINELTSNEKKYLFSEVTFNILISEAII